MLSTQSQSQNKAASNILEAPLQAGLLQRKCDCGNHAISGNCDDCARKKSALQRKAVHCIESCEAPSIVNEVLRSPGQPLDPATRAFMEPRLGHDFSHVRVHTDARAAESARSVNALAYTVGDHIAFQPGRYDPSSVGGQRLLAHELAHVVQNRNSGTSTFRSPNAISRPSDVSEQEASRVAGHVIGGDSVNVHGPATGVM